MSSEKQLDGACQFNITILYNEYHPTVIVALLSILLYTIVSNVLPFQCQQRLCVGCFFFLFFPHFIVFIFLFVSFWFRLALSTWCRLLFWHIDVLQRSRVENNDVSLFFFNENATTHNEQNTTCEIHFQCLCTNHFIVQTNTPALSLSLSFSCSVCFILLSALFSFTSVRVKYVFWHVKTQNLSKKKMKKN